MSGVIRSRRSSSFHPRTRMANVYIAAVRHPCKEEEDDSCSDSDSEIARPQAGLSAAEPPEVMLNMFWREITRLTSRKHDEKGNWSGVEEVLTWNRVNTTKLTPEIRPVLAARIAKPKGSMKLGCDRKTLFLFEMTRSEFFASYDQFLDVFRSKAGQRGKRGTVHSLQPSPRQPRSDTEVKNSGRGVSMPSATLAPNINNCTSADRAPTSTPFEGPVLIEDIPTLLSEIRWAHNLMTRIEDRLLALQGESQGQILASFF
ncbi:hypothetical protein B0H16DRAFT_1481014 [Mycena metata]|uniref:Uncharacterized protein n=1 Tax=Mycena metata TaxID=1033252 RepID=A0AAD7H0R4_9AGAR|nr:hypothetical protein B0H16DRAFT_1481014 [Mycena metata]